MSVFWPGNRNKSSLSSGIEERQERQSYREALVQISPTSEKKKKRGGGGDLAEVRAIFPSCEIGSIIL